MTVSDEILRQGLKETLNNTDLEGYDSKYEGKVRDCYVRDGQRTIVVTDRPDGASGAYFVVRLPGRGPQA